MGSVAFPAVSAGIYGWEKQRRRRFLLVVGLGATALFVLLRALNGYGDPLPWTAQRSAGLTVASFLNARKYPPSLETLVEEKYIRTLPRDPFTQSTETWQVEFSEPDASNPLAEPGVFDVKSGSDRMALDGSPYSEW